MRDDYQLGGYYEAFGGRMSGRVKIEVAWDTPLTDDDRYVLGRACERAFSDLARSQASRDPELKAKGEKEVADLLACFPCPTTHVLLPNGYCSDWCCAHLPWLKVATHRGYITIGWRKRVINIDWSESLITVDGAKLFAGEGVTTWDRGVHAWSYEKATEYLARLLAA